MALNTYRLEIQLRTPIFPDMVSYGDATRAVIGNLVSCQIRVADLGPVDHSLFVRVKEEVLDLISRHSGQKVAGDHPTYAFVKKQDPNWIPLDNGLSQYSLYNSNNSYTYNEDDHHWSNAQRKFNAELTAIPEFYERYFGDSELQNFRLQAIKSGGSLGQHREKIIGIPKRENQYKVRFHLPVVTNDGVKFLMEGESFQMRAGNIYLFNQGAMHGVSNDGDLRIHLIWDVYLNEQLIDDFIYAHCAKFC